jgi:hypothetical protein
MDDARMTATKRKFDIAYMIATENMAFGKMARLCELQERHGVVLGSAYKNEKACATFVDYISLQQQRMLVNLLARASSGNALRQLIYLQKGGTDHLGHVALISSLIRL